MPFLDHQSKKSQPFPFFHEAPPPTVFTQWKRRFSHLKLPSSKPSFICSTSVPSPLCASADAQCLVAKEIWCDKRSKLEALVKSRISKTCSLLFFVKNCPSWCFISQVTCGFYIVVYIYMILIYAAAMLASQKRSKTLSDVALPSENIPSESSEWSAKMLHDFC